MTRQRAHLLAATVIACLGPSCSAVGIGAEPPPSAETQAALEVLLSARHGFGDPDPQLEGYLRTVWEESERVAVALRSMYARIDVTRIAQPDSALRFERAILLLGPLPHPRARAQLAEWYGALDQAALDPTHPQATRNVPDFQRIILLALGSERHPAILSRLMHSLPLLDYGTLVAGLRYLERCCRGDAALIAVLADHLADLNSSLYRSPDVEGTLRVIRHAPAP